MELPSNNGGRTTQGRFSHGNKFGKGRPQGSRNAVSLFIDQLLEVEAEPITSKLVDMAMNGNITAIRLCMDRISPVKKGSTVMLDILPIQNISDTVLAMGMIISAVANGEITTREAIDLTAVIETYRKVIETRDISLRIQEIKERLKEA